MIKLTTANDEYVWVSRDRIVLIEQAKSKPTTGGPPLPVLGVSVVIIDGAPFPLVVKGAPETIANLLVGGDSGRSSLFSA